MERELKACPFCREEIKVNAVKCKHCGSMLGDVPAALADMNSTIRLALAGKYDILEELGRGGMAVVYKAVQRNLERLVAVKALPPHLLHDSELLERFHREARAAARLDHPNIIVVYDEGVESGVHYMAMEYLEGIDVHKLIVTKGRLEVDEVCAYIAPIAAALAYAHEQGIVHRDVKSGNIFIQRGTRPVLTDFGIVRPSTSARLTMAGAVLGTPEFMSPEQASGLEIDGRSDLYSLGVVLYHALSGQLPYRGEHPLATIHHVMHDPHPPIGSLVQVPEWLALLVERCLEKSLQHRIQTGEEIAWCLSRKMPPKLTTDQPTVVLPSPVKTPEPVPGATPLPRQTAVSPPRPLVKEPVVVALAALIFLTVLSLGYLVLGDVVSSGPMIMPAVTYNSLEAAKQQLDRLGLRIETIEGPTQGRAIVISQSPTAGQRIEPRTSVILTTKTATPLVPSVVQLTQLAATVKLEGEGFVVVPMRVAGPLEMSNKVIHQNPGPGTPAPDGKVYISIVR